MPDCLRITTLPRKALTGARGGNSHGRLAPCQEPIGAIIRRKEQEAIAVKAENMLDVSTGDASENHLRMYTEIMLGVPKSESRVIYTQEDSDLYDQIKASVAKEKAQGAILIYGYPASED